MDCIATRLKLTNKYNYYIIHTAVLKKEWSFSVLGLLGIICVKRTGVKSFITFFHCRYHQPVEILNYPKIV